MIPDVIEKRKESLTKMDELQQAIFFDLFNHPSRNEKEFPKEKMDDRKDGDILFDKTNHKSIVFEGTKTVPTKGNFIRIRLNDVANPYYVSSYLNSRYGHTCKQINSTEIKKIRMLIPPKEMQKENI